MRHWSGRRSHAKMDIIRRQGNAAVHKTAPVTANDALPVVARAVPCPVLVARHYTRDPADLPAERAGLRPTLIPRPIPPRCAAEPGRAQGAGREVRRAGRRAGRRTREERQPGRRAGEAARRDRGGEGGQRGPARQPRLRRGADPRPLHRPAARRRPAGALDQPQRPRVPGHRHAERHRQRLRRLRAVGRRRQAARPGRGQADPPGRHASASSRPSCTPTAWSRRYGQRPVIFYTNGYETWLWDDTALSAPRRCRASTPRTNCGC